jgi:hypothetical protein
LANAIYPKWKEAALQGTSGSALNGSGTTGVYVALIDLADYTYSASHEFYSSISSAIVGTPVELTSKTFTNGLFDAADSTLTAVTGDPSEALVYYIRNAGANTTWRLFAFVDTGVTGLPVTPNGGDISIVQNASGIVQL